MSYDELPLCSHTVVVETRRPGFNHQYTQDRLRESTRSPPMHTTNLKKGRRSVFREVGLGPDDNDEYATALILEEPNQGEGRRVSAARLPPLDTRSAEQGSTTAHAHEEEDEEDETTGHQDNHNHEHDDDHHHHHHHHQQQAPSEASSSTTQSPTSKTPWYAKLTAGRRPRVRTGGSSAPPSPVQGLPTMTMIALAVALVAPLVARSNHDPAGVVDAGPISIRTDSPTDVCSRWAQQTALLNGTLYIYGGEAKTYEDQVNNTWNNDFLTLDLTTSWDASSPALTGLPQPSGPPAVALGYLWNDYNNLYLYGGEFADNPYVEPAAVGTWKYAINSATWTEYTGLVTSAGNNSAAGGVALQRAAEGAGVSVPELGLSWYFGGHLDDSTTPGWSDQIARVYLKSLLEFTHPGYTNDAVSSLSGTGAPAEGVYRNITQGGLQTSTGFGERADGTLVFVPGWGTSGVLIGLAGGTVSEYTNDMSTLDIYDIASSQWYHQQSTGTAPGVRVNPCTVVASAPDASSFQIYLFGGQNLQPAGDQIQYDDMYILTIPSFTWIGPIAHSGSSIPFARAGHTCNLRDGQMVVVGGFNTTVTTCDSPGIYIFNASSLEWASSFTALSPSGDLNAGNTVLADSYGYTVPDEVISVIGGNPSGSATVTAPAASATAGPFATGKPPVYTVTASGSTATITSPAKTSPASSSAGGTGDTSSGVDGGLIAAVVIACLAGLSASYLGYCAWLYRRQVRAYKTHLAVTNRFPARSASHGSFGRMLAFGRKPGSKGSSRRPQEMSEKHVWAAAAAAAGGGAGGGHKRDESGSSSAGGESFAWVGRGNNLLDPTTSKATPTSTGSQLSPWSASGEDNLGGSGLSYGSGGEAAAGGDRRPRAGSGSGASTTSSTEGLLEGREPSFFSVILGPRRALRVVNGLEDNEGY